MIITKKITQEIDQAGYPKRIKAVYKFIGIPVYTKEFVVPSNKKEFYGPHLTF